MKILANQVTKLLLFVIASILVLFILFGQLTVKYISNDYKQHMVEHDYNLAGNLLESGVKQAQIEEAFTADKTGGKAQAGSELLQALGYTPDTQTRLFTEVQAFHQHYSVLFLIQSLIFSFIILSVLFWYFQNQSRKIEKANEKIRAFLNGDIQMRIFDRGEGILSQLFSLVNEMATSLTTHIESEKHGREFLKDTISDISHQLKTPLSSLKIYNEIIQNEQTDNKVINDFVSRSERELSRIEVLIQNLLKLARLDAGAIELEKQSHNVKEFLEEVIEGFRTRAELEDKVILLDGGENIMMDFDEVWLLEAVGNIIKNALDHTNTKNEIEIQCAETPILITITIKDNGTGIHSEDIHHIFKRFYRSRFSKDKQGVGIGLTLSKTIMEKHGGTITVESKLGEGTAFRLAFPKLSNL